MNNSLDSAVKRFITKPPIKRILKKANISRVSKDVDESIYEILVEYTEKILQTTLVFTDHAPRKTIQMTDLEAGFKQNNQQHRSAHGDMKTMETCQHKKSRSIDTRIEREI